MLVIGLPPILQLVRIDRVQELVRYLPSKPLSSWPPVRPGPGAWHRLAGSHRSGGGAAGRRDGPIRPPRCLKQTAENKRPNMAPNRWRWQKIYKFTVVAKASSMWLQDSGSGQNAGCNSRTCRCFLLKGKRRPKGINAALGTKYPRSGVPRNPRRRMDRWYDVTPGMGAGSSGRPTLSGVSNYRIPQREERNHD